MKNQVENETLNLTGTQASIENETLTIKQNNAFEFRLSCLIDPSNYTCYRCEGYVKAQTENEALELLAERFSNIGKLDIAHLAPTYIEDKDKYTVIIKTKEWTNSNNDIEPTQGTTITTKTIQR